MNNEQYQQEVIKEAKLIIQRKVMSTLVDVCTDELDSLIQTQMQKLDAKSEAMQALPTIIKNKIVKDVKSTLINLKH